MTDLSVIERRTLLSCLATNGMAQETLADIADPQLSWENLFETASRLGVGPLLYFRMGVLGLREEIPSEVARQRKEEFLSSQARNMKLYADLRRVLTALTQEGIQVVVLKGAALAELAYEHVGLRTMGDVDLLVEKRNLEKAGAIIERLGFLPNEGYGDKQWYRNHHHHLVPYVAPDGSMTVEIHWHIIERTAFVDMPIEELWVHTRPVRIASVPCLALSAEHMLLHVALHLSNPNRFLGQLRGLCDVAELLRRFGHELNWVELLRVTALAGAKKHLYVVLSLVHDALGASVPAGVLRQLQGEIGLLPLEERLLKRMSLRAACIGDVGKHPLYEWVLLDLMKNLLALETRSRAVLDVMRKIVRRCKAAYTRRYRHPVRRTAFRL